MKELLDALRQFKTALEADIKLVFTAYSGAGKVLTVLPDGTLASDGFDNTIKLWDTHTGACLKTLGGHSSPVVKLMAFPDGMLASSSRTESKVWDVRTGACLKTLPAQEGHGQITAMTVLPDGTLVNASSYLDSTLSLYKNIIELWDIRADTRLQTLKLDSKDRGGGQISVLIALPDGTLAANLNNTINILDIHTGKCLKTLQGYSVSAFAILADGTLASGGSGGIKLWDVRGGICLHTFSKNSSTLVALPNGLLASSNTTDQTIDIWDIRDMCNITCLKTLYGHSGAVTGLALLPDGMLASVAGDDTFRIWQVPNSLYSIASLMPLLSKLFEGQEERTARLQALVDFLQEENRAKFSALEEKHAGLALENSKLTRELIDLIKEKQALEAKIQQLEAIVTKRLYPKQDDMGQSAVKIQAAFRGFFARKQLDKLKDERHERIMDEIAELRVSGKKEDAKKLFTLLTGQRLHDAMQIINGREQEEKEFQGIKFKY